MTLKILNQDLYKSESCSIKNITFICQTYSILFPSKYNTPFNPPDSWNHVYFFTFWLSVPWFSLKQSRKQSMWHLYSETSAKGNVLVLFQNESAWIFIINQTGSFWCVYMCCIFPLLVFIVLTRTDVLDSHLKKGPTSLDRGPAISGLVHPELSTEKYENVFAISILFY